MISPISPPPSSHIPLVTSPVSPPSTIMPVLTSPVTPGSFHEESPLQREETPPNRQGVDVELRDYIKGCVPLTQPRVVEDEVTSQVLRDRAIAASISAIRRAVDEVRGQVNLPTLSQAGERGDTPQQQVTRVQPGTLNPLALPFQSTAKPPNTKMNPQDDNAPAKLFWSMRLKAQEWSEWCRKLASWSNGFSSWVYARQKASSPNSLPNRAWESRQQRRANPQAPAGDPQPSTRNRAIRRKANLQKFYRSNPKACMDLIHKAPELLRCEVSRPAAHDYFKQKFAQPGPDSAALSPPVPLWPHNAQVDPLKDPFTVQEVSRVLQGVANKSAPGPDYLRHAAWKRLDSSGDIITAILNTCRLNRKIPSSWKDSTTVLIHKGGDIGQLDNWKPIALQNTIYNIYATAIAKRVTSWAIDSNTMSPSQKGFLPYEGCLEHGFTLRTILQDARRRKQALSATWLDLKDAYTSVPHATLMRVLKLAGLRGSTLEIIRDIYTDSTTHVRTKSGLTPSIVCRRGVKQGCPLSPILFNLVMEAVIRSVESVPDIGYKVAGVTVKSLTYADDLCVLASSQSTTQKMLDMAHQASQWAGLTFNIRKCPTLTILREQGLRQRAVPFQPKLGQELVPALSWNESYKYLGCRTGADPKVELTQLGEDFVNDCEVIMRSDLTDWQKLDALHRFTKPRLVYPLQNLSPSIRWATDLDKAVRKVVKQCLKLPRRTITSFLYTPTRQGGLGIPCVVDKLHIQMVLSAYKLLSSKNDNREKVIAHHELQKTANIRRRDLTTQEFLNSLPVLGEGKRGDIKSLWSDVRVSANHCGAKFQLDRSTIRCNDKTLVWEGRKNLCRLLRSNIHQAYTQRLSQASDQGRAMSCVAAHTASNHWITTGNYTSFGDYRFALKARLNLLPTRTVRQRAGEWIADVSCPKCNEEQETLAHVLNHCSSHVGLLRQRHNNTLAAP